MTVSSGQMPYQYDAILPIRNIPGGWPGIDDPNIGPSGYIIEGAMFVLNAELRKWGVNNLADLTYNLYVHPDLSPSGFEPKADGSTLAGLVGAGPSIISIDNIEQMRDRLQDLFNEYSNETTYNPDQFFEAWLQAAYPESPSGSIRYVESAPNFFLSQDATFLRPVLHDVNGGDFVTTTDLHWLCGSGVLFDIDHGEVVFNPFPFPHGGWFRAPSSLNFRVGFGPVYPKCQTTNGDIPSLVVSRYESDLTGAFANETNFQALGSGKVQIDGYCLLPQTTIELVKGNNDNFWSTLTGISRYSDHIQGLRQVNLSTEANDNSARCYRTPSAISSGLYRLVTYNKRTDVPNTSIESGVVSLHPQGYTVRSSPSNTLVSNLSDIDGQQYEITSDGGLIRRAGRADGIHVFDDAIWIVGAPEVTLPGFPILDSRGLFCVSPITGDMVWYRPAEMTVATAGNVNDPGAFGTHVGLFPVGNNYVRFSRSIEQTLDFSDVDNIEGDYTVYWQLYDQQTLNHSEQAATFSVVGTVQEVPNFDNTRGAILAGGSVYTWQEFNTVQQWTTGLGFVEQKFGVPGVAGRRHYAGGDLLYTMTGAPQTGDPMLAINGGHTSGIGKWSVGPGSFSHDSAKPLRGETHFGHEPRALIHSIFDVTGSTNVSNGIWMIITFPSSPGSFITSDPLYLCRIIEGPTSWQVVESIFLNENVLNQGTAGGPEFPVEGILQDLD